MLSLVLLLCVHADTRSLYTGNWGGGPIERGIPAAAQLIQVKSVREDMGIAPEKAKEILASIDADDVARKLEMTNGVIIDLPPDEPDPERYVRPFTLATPNADEHGPRPDLAWRKERLEKIVFEGLTPEQRTRMTQIQIQVAGPLSLLNRGIARQANITKEQSAALRDLGTAIAIADRAVINGYLQGNYYASGVSPRLASNLLNIQRALDKLLSADQRKILSDLAGEAYPRKRPAGG